jgi:antitoxin (DNA-binding transcriptional repressor) of toxin-antitoxin stability system
MAGKTVAVGAFEAKTRLSELLRATEEGVTFVIHRRGKAMARLTPMAPEERSLTPREVLRAFRKIRRRIPGKVNVRELIAQGRRR